MTAARGVLDRGYGKPSQAITDADGGNPSITVAWRLVAE
jgi:hypothetical protein